MDGIVSELRPHPGPQEKALSCEADVLFTGGAAGGGKSWVLLVESLRNIGVKNFNAVIFRSSYPQIMMSGGLWDESNNIYPGVGGKDLISRLTWNFPAGSKITFAHINSEQEKYNWAGAQIPLICFDQLEDFSEKTFFFLFSRNRSTCGVKPYIRATCNPDAEVWIAKFIEWYLDEDGYPDPEKVGVLRYFYRVDNEIKWYNSIDEAKEKNPELAAVAPPKSFTFINSNVYDNPTLLEKNPEYVANLMSLPLVERERLLKGNWKIKLEAGNIFNRAWFKIAGIAPATGKTIRYWDKAATENGGCYSAGVKIKRDEVGQFWVEDCLKGQWSSLERERIIKQMAEMDGKDVVIWIEQEPGSGGKESAESTIRNLAGFSVYADKVTGSKIERWQPYAAQVEAGNVKIVSGAWNRDFIEHHHAASADAVKLRKTLVDEIDAAAGAFNKLCDTENDWGFVNIGRER